MNGSMASGEWSVLLPLLTSFILVCFAPMIASNRCLFEHVVETGWYKLSLLR